MRTLLTGRWLLALLLVILAVISCILLGRWQLHRHEAKVRSAAVITENYDAEPVPISTPLPDRTAALASDQDYRVVELRGRFSGEPVYVRNRVQNGEVGFYQLVPFTTEDGTVLLVRGWVPADDVDSAPAVQPAVPTDAVTVRARLRPMEPHLTERRAVAGQIQSITVADVEQAEGPLKDPYLQAYAVSAAEDPAADPALAPLPKPDLSLGPHLSYAFQWWIFAAFFPIGLIVAARRAVRDAEEQAAAEAESLPSSRRAARRLSDEDEEDALLDEEGR